MSRIPLKEHEKLSNEPRPPLQDKDLSERLYGNREAIQKLVDEYFHHM